MRYDAAQDVAGALRGALGVDARARGVGNGVDGLGGAQHGGVGQQRVGRGRVEAEAVDEARRLLQSAVVRAPALVRQPVQVDALRASDDSKASNAW